MDVTPTYEDLETSAGGDLINVGALGWSRSLALDALMISSELPPIFFWLMSIARFEARVNSKECIARNSNLTCPGTRWLRASIALNLKKKIAEEMVPEVTRSNCTQGVCFFKHLLYELVPCSA